MDDDLPQSISSSTLTIMGVDLTVHVLSDGRRIIEADGLEAFMAALEGDTAITEDDAMQLARAIRA